MYNIGCDGWSQCWSSEPEESHHEREQDDDGGGAHRLPSGGQAGRGRPGGSGWHVEGRQEEVVPPGHQREAQRDEPHVRVGLLRDGEEAEDGVRKEVVRDDVTAGAGGPQISCRRQTEWQVDIISKKTLRSSQHYTTGRTTQNCLYVVKMLDETKYNLYNESISGYSSVSDCYSHFSVCRIEPNL